MPDLRDRTEIEIYSLSHAHLLLVLEKDEGIVYTISNNGLLCIASWG